MCIRDSNNIPWRHFEKKNKIYSPPLIKSTSRGMLDHARRTSPHKSNNACPGIFFGGAQKCTIFSAKSSGSQRFFALYDFPLLLFLFSLTKWGFKIQQILRRLREIVVATICRILRFDITFLLFSIAREGFRFQLISRKVRKIVPYFIHFPYVFIA